MSCLSFLRRLPLVVGLAGVLGASLSGCGGGGGSVPSGGSGRAACQQNPHTNGRARWTVLVYMDAANDLQPDSVTNVQQMLNVGSNADVNIVVQWKQANCSNCGTPTFIGTRRYLVHQGTFQTLDANDRLPDPVANGTVDMGDWHTLQQFIQWGIQTYPADHLAVVIWDHGSGWLPALASSTPALVANRQASASNRRTPSRRAVAIDNDSNNEIETQQIPLALQGASVDMLIIDCSLEQMVEVAYQVRNAARVMVGSEESPPGTGYPYDAWLGDLKASVATANPCTVGNDIVQRFVAAYPTQTDITQSVLDLSKMDAVATALGNFANTLTTHTVSQATLIQSARENAQSYAYPDNKDLYHYADLIRTGAGTTGDLQQAATALQTSLTGPNGAIIANGHGSTGQSGSFGLAVYVPAPGNYDTDYNALALAGTTNWGKFLQRQQQ